VRVTRVYVDAPLAGGALLWLPPGPAQHVARVLRAAPGHPLIVFNGMGGEFAATIEALRRDAVQVRLGAHQAVERESPLVTILLQGVARGEKMDQILQKATELGVSRVLPVLSARSTVRLEPAAAQRKQHHWQAVAIGACEQCGRNRVPQVEPPMSLAAALERAAAGLRLVLAPDGSTGLRSLPLGTQVARSVALLAGPEGGLAPEEVAAAAQAGFITCRLGPRVLRTETAALAALAALQFAAGDLDHAAP